jgi:hypothetical protein
MSINTQEVIDFFWNGLTSNQLIDPINSYVEMEVRIRVSEDRYVSNGWRYQAPPGEYITQSIITEVVQGISANLQTIMNNGNASNPIIMKLHKPGTQSRSDILREQEYFNVNSVIGYQAISVVLRTVYTTPTQFPNQTLISQPLVSGAQAASSMEDTSVYGPQNSDVPASTSDTTSASA